MCINVFSKPYLAQMSINFCNLAGLGAIRYNVIGIKQMINTNIVKQPT